jgi:hypothetical protein
MTNSSNQNNSHSFDSQQDYDVNPIVAVSEIEISKAVDNFRVVKLKTGEFRNLNVQPMSFFEKAKKAAIKYYEVDKRNHQFTYFTEAKSKNALHQFEVDFHFQLRVTDPCRVVEEQIELLRRCVEPYLDQMATRTLRDFDITELGQANRCLEQDFETVAKPASGWSSYLQFTLSRCEVNLRQDAIDLIKAQSEFKYRVDAEAVNVRLDAMKKAGQNLVEQVEDSVAGEVFENGIAALRNNSKEVPDD